MKMNRQLFKIMLYGASLVLAGYYGASFAQSTKDMKACQAEMTECHREFSPWGFEVVGK